MSPAQYPDTANTVFNWYTLKIAAGGYLFFQPGVFSAPFADNRGYKYWVCDQESQPISISTRRAGFVFASQLPQHCTAENVYAFLERDYSAWDAIYLEETSPEFVNKAAKLIIKKRA